MSESDSARRLPARPSLEQLHKQAKELLRDSRVAGGNLILADAQFALARQYGFESWARLKHHVETLRPPAPLFVNSTPPFHQIDWIDNALTVRGPLSPEDWDTIAAVMKEHRLTGLNARGVTDDAMAQVAQLTEVTTLRIADSKTLSDDGVRLLAQMPQLQDLDLGGSASPITDTGLDHALRHLPELRRFQMCWTPGVSDAGFSGFALCDRIENVNLLGTPTGDGVIHALAGKRNLRHLRTGQRVTDDGLAALAQLPAFRTWQEGELTCSLMSAEAGPNHLLLDGPFTNAGIASLGALEGLRALSFFWHCPAFTSAGLAPLRSLPHLGFLGCQDAHCDDEALDHIGALSSLRMLMGQGAVASDKGFERLSRSRTLEYIWGRDCPNLTGAGFAALSQLPALRGLAVSCRNVDVASLSLLPDFPALRELMPMDVTDDGFRHIGRCRDLEALWCMYCRETGDTATEHLAGLSRLSMYYAGRTGITDRSLDILSHIASLERLDFWQCTGISADGLARLSALPRLRELRLDGLPGIGRDALALFPAHVRIRYSA